jgi:putative nucleotidyltransferase with HDIG domain
MTDNKSRILEILRATRRPGIEAVINYLETSNYFRRGCYSHHKERGGLAQHSLEVFEHMCANAGDLSADSIAVAAFFHDLGKTRKRDGRGHETRSLDILAECGFALTDAERIAIGKHHGKSLDFITCPLRRTLSLADCNSTGAWKSAHPKHNKSHE